MRKGAIFIQNDHDSYYKKFTLEFGCSGFGKKRIEILRLQRSPTLMCPKKTQHLTLVVNASVYNISCSVYKFKI